MRTDNDWLEEAWLYRDTVLYPKQLGSGSTGTITTIPYVAFAQMGAEQVDPRWLHCGVLVFPPTAGRRHYTFLTSGLSNAWDDNEPDPASISGLGIELRIDTFSDEHWAKDVLLRLSAMQLLVGAGRLAGVRLLGHGDRIRVGAETFGGESRMTSLLATEVADLQLPSGAFRVIQLFAITDAERQLATAHGTDALLTSLREMTAYPVNDIARHSTV